ncbi:hypothetical protein ACIOEX_26140 [Streptomyces sp. NPDC087850]|uniref:hypothetical protein n=1 Tax=Streptomyces sp. NPDC087850 TaxID=3365809 RepID=UPI0037FC987D
MNSTHGENHPPPPPETLDSLLSRLYELEIGREYPVASNFCKYCESTDLAFVVKLEAVPGSLAGVQIKTSARAWPFLKCRGCNHESRGNVE